MRDQASAEEIAAYQRDGFVVLRDVLDAGEVAAWRTTQGEALWRRWAAGCPTRAPGTASSSTPSTTTTTRSSPRRSTCGGPIRRSGRWCSARTSAGSPRSSPAARVYLDQALVKESYANPTAFHIDVPFWAFTSPDALTIWIAMDDVTVENGCLAYIPGSHAEQRFDNVDIGPELGALFEAYPQWKNIEPVFCPVSAGSAVVHNGLTAHGAGANMTPWRRFAMTVAYLPDGAAFNGKQDIYTTGQVAGMKVGDPLDDPDLNPLVYPAPGSPPAGGTGTEGRDR